MIVIIIIITKIIVNDDIDDEEFDQVQRLLLGGDNEFDRVAFPVAEIILIIIHKY